VQDLPRDLAGFLALLGAAAVSFATATTLRQRRHDLAVLRVIGMTRGHVRAVVAMFVLALSVSGAVVGVGLGLIVGRLVWRAVAESVAVPFAPGTPVIAMVLVPVAALLLAQLVATRSRLSATQIPAAMVLRTE
jgi:ABC-type antimicrobial peptide transport system permease subunit